MDRKIMRALISVTDKGGVVDFAKSLAGMGGDHHLHRRHHEGAEGRRRAGHRRQ